MIDIHGSLPISRDRRKIKKNLIQYAQKCQCSCLKKKNCGKKEFVIRWPEHT